MKICIPIWKGAVSPRMDASKCLRSYTVGSLSEITYVDIDVADPSPEAVWFQLMRLEPSVILCGGISRQFEDLLVLARVDVISGCCGDAGVLLSSYLQGTLGCNLSCRLPEKHFALQPQTRLFRTAAE